MIIYLIAGILFLSLPFILAAFIYAKMFGWRIALAAMGYLSIIVLSLFAGVVFLQLAGVLKP